jgi:hypothetical protein
VDVSSSHQFEEEIGAASSGNGLFIAKMEFSIRCDTKSLMRLLCLNLHDTTQCSAIGTLPGCAVGAIQRCKALGTMQPHSNEWQSNREGRLRLLASERSGARVDGMGNRCELLINVVKSDKSKMLTDLNQKVSGMAEEFLSFLSQTMTPPANR